MDRRLQTTTSSEKIESNLPERDKQGRGLSGQVRRALQACTFNWQLVN